MLYATVGVHPHNANEYNNQTSASLETLASHNNVVAIGETGLDFNRNFSTKSQQISAFESQLELAAKKQLPLFMHERDAAKQQLEILRDYRDHFTQGVIHCFTGDRNEPAYLTWVLKEIASHREEPSNEIADKQLLLQKNSLEFN